MRLISERSLHRRPPKSWLSYGVSACAVAAAAVLGARAVDADSGWYRSLRKPPWQPPPWAFGAVWTPLYGTVAYAAGHALNTAPDGPRRVGLSAGLAVNLALNTGWNWLFFGLRRPAAGLCGVLLLDLSNAGLIRHIHRFDPSAGRALVPYAGWCVFATALNGSIVRRNPSHRVM